MTIVMHNRLWLAAVLATTPILALSPVAFPANNEPGCIRATAGARKAQRSFMSLMRRRDDETERRLRVFAVPHVRPREVKQVSDDDICALAANAYADAVRMESPGKVNVLHIGGRFVVTDADNRRSVTFDSSFTRVLAAVED